VPHGFDTGGVPAVAATAAGGNPGGLLTGYGLDAAGFDGTCPVRGSTPASGDQGSNIASSLAWAAAAVVCCISARTFRLRWIAALVSSRSLVSSASRLLNSSHISSGDGPHCPCGPGAPLPLGAEGIDPHDGMAPAPCS